MTESNPPLVSGWRRPAGCESSGCVEVKFLAGGTVMVRSSTHPHSLAILDRDEWEQLRTGDFGEVTR